MVVQNPLIKENPQESNLEDIRTISKKLKNVVSGSVFVSDQPKESKLKSKASLIFLGLASVSSSLLYLLFLELSN